jgi:hypothetical protein
MRPSGRITRHSERASRPRKSGWRKCWDHLLEHRLGIASGRSLKRQPVKVDPFRVDDSRDLNHYVEQGGRGRGAANQLEKLCDERVGLVASKPLLLAVLDGRLPHVICAFVQSASINGILSEGYALLSKEVQALNRSYLKGIGAPMPNVFRISCPCAVPAAS